VASSERARHELGWRPRFADLDEIVRTALLWREAHPNGYAE
jgi:UDP-glucose 4-epimerase